MGLFVRACGALCKGMWGSLHGKQGSFDTQVSCVIREVAGNRALFDGECGCLNCIPGSFDRELGFLTHVHRTCSERWLGIGPF